MHGAFVRAIKSLIKRSPMTEQQIFEVYAKVASTLDEIVFAVRAAAPPTKHCVSCDWCACIIPYHGDTV